MSPQDDPSVTLIICSYNQEKYIREAVEGAFAQTYSPIEIILSDDCSSDATFEVIQELAADYQGPNTVILNRNPINVGLIEHVNKVLAMASGELIIGSAGDDISLPHRVEYLVTLYKESSKKAILFHGDVLKIGPSSEDLGLMPAHWGRDSIDLNATACSNSLYIGASSTFTRQLLNQFPPIQYKNAYEDLVWGFRAALIDALVFVSEPLVKYRLNVGISWKLHTQSLDPTIILQKAEEQLRILKDVLAQRLLDVEHVDTDGKLASVKETIKSKLLKTEIDHALLTRPYRSLVYLLCSPQLYIKRLKSLRKRKRKLLKAYQQDFHTSR